MWILFVIFLESDGYFVAPSTPFLTIDDCFEAREIVIQSAPQPKINYEAVCIQTDKIGDL